MKPTAVRFDPPGDASEGWVITRWRVAVGDTVAAGQTLVELEGDKASVELPSPVDGVVLEVLHAEGRSIEGDTVLAMVGPPQAAEHPDLAAARAQAAPPAALAVKLRAECPECGARTAINGPHEVLPCIECGASSPISPDTWSMILEAIGRGRDFIRILADPWAIVIRTARRDPACHNCNRPLLLTPGDGPVDCVTCGLAHPRQATPEWMRASLPWVTTLLGTLPPSAPPRHGVDPACPSCGTRARVRADATAVPRCIACGTDVRDPARGNPLPRDWYLLQ